MWSKHASDMSHCNGSIVCVSSAPFLGSSFIMLNADQDGTARAFVDREDAQMRSRGLVCMCGQRFYGCFSYLVCNVCAGSERKRWLTIGIPTVPRKGDPTYCEFALLRHNLSFEQIDKLACTEVFETAGDDARDLTS